MPISKTNFLDVSTHVSLKVAIKVIFRGKNPQTFSIVITIFLKQKWGSAIKKIEMVLLSF